MALTVLIGVGVWHLPYKSLHLGFPLEVGEELSSAIAPFEQEGWAVRLIENYSSPRGRAQVCYVSPKASRVRATPANADLVVVEDGGELWIPPLSSLSIGSHVSRPRPVYEDSIHKEGTPKTVSAIERYYPEEAGSTFSVLHLARLVPGKERCRSARFDSVKNR